jgi:hypothetical protein
MGSLIKLALMRFNPGFLFIGLWPIEPKNRLNVQALRIP